MLADLRSSFFCLGGGRAGKGRGPIRGPRLGWKTGGEMPLSPLNSPVENDSFSTCFFPLFFIWYFDQVELGTGATWLVWNWVSDGVWVTLGAVLGCFVVTLRSVFRYVLRSVLGSYHFLKDSKPKVESY